MGLVVPWLAGSELKGKLAVFLNGRLAAMLCRTGMLPYSPSLARSLRPGPPPPIDVVFMSKGESVDNRTVNCFGRIIPFMIACAGRSVGISSLFGSTMQLRASALHCSEQVRSEYNCQTGRHLPDRLIFNCTFYKP